MTANWRDVRPIRVKHSDDVSHMTQEQPYGVRFEPLLALGFLVLALGIAAAKGWGWI